MACLVPGQGGSPLGLVLGLWPRGPADTSAFLRVCADMAERFPEPADARTGVYLAFPRLLVADGLTEADTARLDKLARTARDSEPDNSAYSGLYGAALYRSAQVLQGAGQSPAAAKFREWLQQLDAAVKKNGKGGSVWQQCFLAMTHHRLGHVEEGRAWLTKAVRQFQAMVNPEWEVRVQWYSLRQETEITLGWHWPDGRVEPAPEGDR